MTTIDIDANFGQVAHKISNHYHGDYARYKAMTLEELRAERESLRRRRRATYRSFIRHPTVPYFGGANAALAVSLYLFWGKQPSVIAWIGLAVCFAATIVTLLLMTFFRRPIADALRILKADLKLVEALLAIKMAEVSYGDKALFSGR